MKIEDISSDVPKGSSHTENNGTDNFELELRWCLQRLEQDLNLYEKEKNIKKSW